MKTCSICKTEKPLESFYKDASYKGGYNNRCIPCYETVRKARERREYPITVTKRSCTQCGVEKPATEFNRNKRQIGGIMSYCKQCRKPKTRARYESNRDVIKKQTNDYYHANKAKIMPQRLAYQKRKMKSDPLYVLSRRLRNRLYYALLKKSWKKNTQFSKYIGCTLEELKIHIEKQFVDGMSWDNRDLWHLDHKIPLNSAGTIEEMHALCHYTNIQPMWAEDNLTKGAKTT